MRRLLGARLAWSIAAVSIAAVVVQARQSSPSQKPEAEYSPLGYYDLRAYEQAYPGVPGSALVMQAATGRYWVYRGIAYRGADPLGATWMSLGPETNLQDPTTQSSGNISGRVTALAISPPCKEHGACRKWVGAGGGWCLAQ